MNSLLTEEWPLVATIDPDVYAVGEHVSDWVDMSRFHDLLATLTVGVMGTVTSANIKLQQAKDDDGSPHGAPGTPADMSGKVTTLFTQAGTDAGKTALINLRAEEMNMDSGYRWVRAVLTVADATSPENATVAAQVTIRARPKTGHGGHNDLTSVVQIVA